ncbi:alpha/beta fold hydrolase [Maribacter sp. R77961]|uniref:alpha/beta fold hydrolase n=1 Tax=Maribacter sp. R77961 TaxID=3093871 RepID=UPI0037CC62BB
MDIWYPSTAKNGDRLLFEDLYRLHEERANKYQDDNNYTGMSDEFVLYLAAGFGVEATDGKRLLKVKTESFENIPPANGKFPLVIYLAGYNGMGWESYRLLERLAEKGFVVLSISSIGTYPGDMTNGLLDTMEQVYDGEFALEELKKIESLHINFDNIGILGLSWGGMSGAIMLDKHPEIKAFASLDGSDVFYYGDTDEDDVFLSEIYDADLIHPEKTNAAYLYIESGDKLDEFTPTGEYHYFKKINTSKNYMRFTNSKHDDFGSIAWALKTTEAQVELYEETMETTVLFFQKHLKQSNGYAEYYTNLLQKKNITEKPFEYSTEKPKELIISGLVQDSKTKIKLPYVNIGILNKEIGTVSDREGSFDFHLTESNAKDTIRISMIGYKPKILVVDNLLNKKGEIEVNLEEEISELNEVVVTARKWKKKTLGNKTKSTFIGHIFYYEQLGKEMGIKMNVGRKPTFVDDFNFHISYNRFSAKSFFRLNMYKIVNGKPSENILKNNIIISVEPKQTGMISTNLKEYDIVLTEDVIVTLEWVDNEGEIKPTEGLIVSVGLLTGGTYERDSKESSMKKKLKGMGLGFTMNVRY